MRKTLFIRECLKTNSLINNEQAKPKLDRWRFLESFKLFHHHRSNSLRSFAFLKFNKIAKTAIYNPSELS